MQGSQHEEGKIETPSTPSSPDGEEKHGVRNGVIAAIVIVVLVAAGIYFATKGDGTEDATADNSDGQSAADVQEEIKTEDVEALKANPEEKEVKGAFKDGKFMEVANKGDGVTHLARRALQNYEKVASDKVPENFTNEHRIYVEDYLMKNTSTRSLEIAEEVQFEEGLVEDAVKKASELTEAQLKNLEQYSRLVF